MDDTLFNQHLQNPCAQFRPHPKDDPDLADSIFTKFSL